MEECFLLPFIGCHPGRIVACRGHLCTRPMYRSRDPPHHLLIYSIQFSSFIYHLFYSIQFNSFIYYLLIYSIKLIHLLFIEFNSFIYYLLNSIHSIIIY